jgi:hypothetical protein
LGGRFVNQAPTDINADRTLGFSTTDNGVNWTIAPGAGEWSCFNSSAGDNATTCDTQTNIFYDPWREEYAMYTRDWRRYCDEAGCHHWHYRTVRRLRCDRDRLPKQEWTDPKVVMEATTNDWPLAYAGSAGFVGGSGAMDVYGAVVWPYTESSTPLYFMFLQRTWHWGSTPGANASKMAGPAMIDVGLAFSRDGINFAHMGDRESFLHGGAPGSFDSKFQWMMPNPVKRDDEIFYYYGGLNRDHAEVIDGGTLRSGVGLARGRLDGLTSLDAPLYSQTHRMAQLW